MGVGSPGTQAACFGPLHRVTQKGDGLLPDFARVPEQLVFQEASIREEMLPRSNDLRWFQKSRQRQDPRKLELRYWGVGGGEGGSPTLVRKHMVLSKEIADGSLKNRSFMGMWGGLRKIKRLVQCASVSTGEAVITCRPEREKGRAGH